MSFYHKLAIASIGGMGGSLGTVGVYRWTVEDNRRKTTHTLNMEYGRDVQYYLAFLGAQQNYLHAHGVSMVKFMEHFPKQADFEGQFEDVDGKGYLSLKLWLDVRKACHQLNSYWDSMIDGSERGLLDLGDNERSSGKADTLAPLNLEGRWGYRARNFVDLVEPLEKANFYYMDARGSYTKPGRFTKLQSATTWIDQKHGQTKCNVGDGLEG